MTEAPDYKTYRHNPPHLFLPGATYMITAATQRKRKLFATDGQLEMLRSALLRHFSERGWQITAYVVLPNHYHVLAESPERQPQLAPLIRAIHQETAYELRRRPSQRMGRIWWNYWDTCITKEASYLARMNYIHFNPVKHGYVKEPHDWNYCSFRDYYAANPAEITRTIRDHPFDRVSIEDDY